MTILFLTLLAFATRFWILGFPDGIIFDEAYFVVDAQGYLAGEYVSDIHPPLGKLLYALVGWMGFYLRLLPALLGTLLIPLVYIFVKELGFSRRTAFLAGFFVLFDNALLVQSRFVLLDIILLFFIVLSLYLFVFSLRRPAVLLFCGVALGAAISVKWIGFGAMAVIWMWLLVEKRSVTKSQILLLLVLPFVLYILIFWIHFSLIPTTGNLLGEIAFEHYQMFYNNILLEGIHPAEAEWYLRPFLAKPIIYWIAEAGEKTSYLYLLGNPFIWWGAILAMIGMVSWLFRKGAPATFYLKSTYFIFLCYLIFFLPFAAIPRPSFLYHYFPALIFSFILFAIFLDGLFLSFPKKKANIAFISILVVVVAGFVYFAPLSYAFPLTEGEYNARMWLPSWK
ncbi:phospholipid carrier-dependent glycosyltransferase [Patescibacteria group bacterium]|nr:phospholipid carrier-dependent glycosyltransferase [Patescibacteria group bacterium]